MTTIEAVTKDNWFACSQLTVHEHQKGNVASNLHTIAESRFCPHYHLRAIVDCRQVVGMLAYCHEDDPEDLTLYWVFRLLIGKEYQRQGHATQAMRLALEEIRQRGAKRVRTMHKPCNTAAAALYRNLGFEPIGLHDDGDTLLEIRNA